MKTINVKVTVELMVFAEDSERAALMAQNIVHFAVGKAYGWNHVERVEVIAVRD